MKKYSIALTLTVLAFALSMYGCNKASDGAVLAKVNRSTITAPDFKKQLEDLTPQMQQAVVMDPKARAEFLEDLIGIELVIQEAKRQGLDKDAEYKKRQEQLKKELERRIQEEAKNDLFNSLLKKELGDKMTAIKPATDKEVADYFNQNKEKINKAAGKKIALKDVEQQLKMRMTQEKRREVYVEYAKGLKAKAKISVDEKAMEKVLADFTKPADLSGMTVTKVPAAAKEETKK
jgi:peptidyl-prolyl cis-trans isomerase C